MPKIIFIPSSGGNSQSVFYKSVGQSLVKNSFETIYFDISQKNLLSKEAWQKPLEGIKDRIDEETYLVSHSNGTFAVSRFLSDNDIKIKSWHIVAGAFDPKIIKSTDGDFAITQAQNILGEEPIDWTKINQNCESVILHYSKDDLVVNFEEWQKYRQKFPESILQKYDNYGHFGITDFPELTNFILNQEKNSWTYLENQKYRIKLLKKENLPLELPKIEDYQPSSDGRSPLSKNDWINLRNQNGEIIGKRESDTMPNWAGSSWYYLRYTDPKNSEFFASQENLKYWLPVDHYFGGNEHTTMHLLYSRFWHKFLYEQGFVPTEEPYQKRTNGGILLGPDGQKMSKSKGNVINPKEKLEDYGADALRLYIAFIGPYDATVIWQDGGLKACKRVVDNIWELSKKVEKEEVEKEEVEKINKASLLDLQNLDEIDSQLKKLETRAKNEGLQIFVDGLISNSQDQIFVQKRNNDRKLYPNCWDFVGGHLEKNETILEVLKREVQEETGWNLRKVKNFVSSSEEILENGIKVLLVALEVEVEGNLANPKLEKNKVDEFKWINKQEIKILKENRIDSDNSWIFDTAKKFFEEAREKLKTETQKYLIFDFDGVLGNTKEAWVKAHAKYLKISETEAKEMVEKHTSTPYHSNKNNLSKEVLDKFVTQMLETTKIMPSDDYSLFEEFLKQIEKIKNAKIAIVSSGSRELLIKPSLKNSNLSFSHVLGLEDHHSKEHKIQQICEDWGVNIQEVYYFTDTRSDVLELWDCMDKTKIIGCSWGWEGKQKLLELLPKEQILEDFEDIISIFKNKTFDSNSTLNRQSLNQTENKKEDKKLLVSYHKFLRNITTQIQELRNNVAVAEIMIFINLLKEQKSIPIQIWRGFLQVIAPFMPHISEELWYQLHDFDQQDISKSVHLTTWPKFDPSLCIEDVVVIAVQINGKMRGTFEANKDEKEEVLTQKTKEITSKWLENKTITFTKIIPNKIISLVVK